MRPDAGVQQIHVPLSLVLQPDLLKELRTFVQQAKDDRGMPIKELGALSRDQFLEWYMQHTTMKTGHEPGNGQG